jgi:hypothetical protein
MLNPPRWAEEMAPDYHGLTIAKVLAVGALLWALALAGSSSSAPTTASRSKPADTPVCVERARLERHGVRSGPHYRATAAACRRMLQEGATP